MRLFLALILLLSSYTYGQVSLSNKPNICTNPPSGYALLESLSILPTLACVFENNTDSVSVTISNKVDSNFGKLLQNPKFFVDISDSVGFDSEKGLPLINHSVVAKLAVGNHWIVLEGEYSGKKYLSCKFYESFRVFRPIVLNDTCFANKVSFVIPKDERNNNDVYEVNWGNGQVESFQMKNLSLPMKVEKTLTNKIGMVTIQGFFVRHNLKVCQTQFITIIDNREWTNPHLTNLVPDNTDKSVLLKYFNPTKDEVVDIMGIEESEFNLGSWKEMGKATRDEGRLLDLDNEKNYCFRVRSTDNCGNKVFTNEVFCTIGLNVIPESIDRMAVSWKIPNLMSIRNPRIIIEKRVVGCNECLVDSVRIPSNQNNFSFSNLSWNKSYSFKLNYMELDTVLKGKHIYSGVESFVVAKDFSSQITSTGVESVYALQVSPNPSTKIINLMINKKITAYVLLELISNKGEINVLKDYTVDEMDNDSTKISLNLESLKLSTGIYILRFSTHNFVSSAKIMIN